MSFKVNDGKIPRADLLTVITEMEKIYPGKKVLVKLSAGKIGRVIDVLTAPVAGYHNPKKDLLEIEAVVEIDNPKFGEEGQPEKLLAPTGHISRAHMGMCDIIGMM